MNNNNQVVMLASQGAIYRHYQITAHAIDRYMERIGGDIGNMVSDLDCAWLFDINRKGLARSLCASVARHERTGGYALTNGRVVFIIGLGQYRHHIVTILDAESPSSKGRYFSATHTEVRRRYIR